MDYKGATPHPGAAPLQPRVYNLELLGALLQLKAAPLQLLLTIGLFVSIQPISTTAPSFLSLAHKKREANGVASLLPLVSGSYATDDRLLLLSGFSVAGCTFLFFFSNRIIRSSSIILAPGMRRFAASFKLL